MLHIYLLKYIFFIERLSHCRQTFLNRMLEFNLEVGEKKNWTSKFPLPSSSPKALISGFIIQFWWYYVWNLFLWMLVTNLCENKYVTNRGTHLPPENSKILIYFLILIKCLESSHRFQNIQNISEHSEQKTLFVEKFLSSWKKKFQNLFC